MAVDNRKPIKEEDIDKQLDETEGLDPNAPDPEDEEVETPVTTPPADPPVTPPVTPTPAPTPNPNPQPAPTPAPNPEPAKPIDYERKSTESAREAMILVGRNKKFTTAVDEAANLPEPTVEDLKSEYPEWDSMTQTEQRLAKDNLVNKRKFDRVHQAVEETKKVEEWADSVDKYLAENPNTELEGKEEAFKSYCMKPTKRGLDFETLVAAFLYTQPAATQHKGSLLETGTGGPKDSPKPKEYSAEEAASIRKRDPKLYKRLVMEGKINIDV